MEQSSNILLTVIFFAIAAWLFYGYFKTRGLIYKDRLWSGYRIFFLIAGIICALSALVYTTLWDWLRLGGMLLCVVAFFLQRDGIREDGFAVTGRLYPFAKLRAWDYGDYKKDLFRIYFMMENEDNDNGYVLTMPLKQKDGIIQFLKGKIGKKYTRLKKG